MPFRRFLSPPTWLFLLVFSVRLLVVVRLSGMPYFVPNGGDMKFYSDWALRIAHGEWTDHQSFYGLPGYPFLLAGLYKILNFDRFAVAVVAGLIQGIVDSLTCVLIWFVAREAFGTDGRRGAVIGGLAGIGWTLYQPAQTFSTVLMPTSLAVCSLWLCVWVFMRRRPFSLWLPWLPLGVLIGFEAMIVATILFIVPMGLAAIFFRYRAEERGQKAHRWAGAWRPVVAAGGLFAGVYAGSSPCWLHNYVVAREPVMLSAHSGLNFYIGNNPIATGYPKMPPGMSAGQQGMLRDSITFAEKAEGRPLKHYEVSRFWAARAHEYIAGHRGEWLRLMGIKLWNFWNAFQYDDLSLISLFGGEGLLLPGPRFGWVAALAIPGILLALWRRSRAGWIVAGVLLHMAALLPVFITERYRLAAMPGLLLMAAYAIWELWECLSQARWATALALAGAEGAAAFFIATPPLDSGLWSLDCYNTGIKALDEGRLDTAQRDLEMAYRYVPDNSEINFALGILWQTRGDVARSQGYYHRALEINPHHAGAWNNMGMLAARQKAWPIAERCFLYAIEANTTDAKAYYMRARSLAALARWDEARKTLDEAMRLQPGEKDFEDLSKVIDRRDPVSPP